MIHLLAIFISVQVCGALSPPQPMPDGVYTGAIIRIFAASDRVTWMGEVAAANQSDDRKPLDYTLGGYYSLTPNWKVGGFVRRAYGVLHDEDWQHEPGAYGPGLWSWNRTNGRGETNLIFDVTGKFLLGVNWVAELKSRYICNRFNDHRTLLVRPGISYFWIHEGRLLANAFIQLELDFPLNYGTRTISEKWLYLGSLFHINSTFDIGPYATLAWQTWGQPQSYTDKGGAPYSVTAQSTTLGLLFIANL